MTTAHALNTIFHIVTSIDYDPEEAISTQAGFYNYSKQFQPRIFAHQKQLCSIL